MFRLYYTVNVNKIVRNTLVSKASTANRLL